jgi:putative SOS response-associated peptidase YedK
MCNLYSITTTQQAQRNLFKVRPQWDRLGNFPAKYAVFPDNEAPVVRMDPAGSGERELLMMRWGMPGPEKFGGYPITNIRNPTSPHWRGWLKPQYRCLVPATAFCEPTSTKPAVWTWFARESQDRRPFAFAGVWRPWTGRRGTKANPVDGDHLLFSFLTTEPNEIVLPVHQKAMPVILTEDTWDAWLELPVEEALKLQKPAPADLLSIVARGEKRDPPVSSEDRQLEEMLF